MKNENETAGTCRDSRAFGLLDKYRRILQDNDYLISTLDVMEKIPSPSVSQRARIKELEERLIPDGIRAEKDLGGLLRPIVAELQASGSTTEAKRRTVIELRYFSLLGWNQIAEVIYQERWTGATKKQQAVLLRQNYRIHADALEQLDALLRDRGL